MKYLFAAVVLHASAASAATFVGCILTNSRPGSVLTLPPVSNNAQCQASCTILPYSYYSPSNGCWCSGNGPPAGGLAAGSSSSCPGFVSSLINTPFNDAQCYSGVLINPLDASSPSSVVNAPDTCLTNCKNYRFALMQPQGGSGGTGGTYTCKCLNEQYQTTGTSGCTATSYYVYTSRTVVSRNARRQERAAIMRQQLELSANQYCPVSYTPCYVSSDKGAGYECLKVESELESCGGCKFGEVGGITLESEDGVDCTAIEGVHPFGVTCAQGFCEVSRCRPGFRLALGECIAWKK